MFHKKIRIPKESASDVMEELGKLDDAIQFVDLNINDFEERKNFGNYIARCDDAEKKISSFEGICETYGEKFIKYNSYQTFKIDLENSKEQVDKRYGSTYFDLLEGELAENEKKITELIESYNNITESLDALIEKKSVFDKSSQLMAANKPPGFSNESISLTTAIDNRNSLHERLINFGKEKSPILPEDGGITDLNFIAGVIRAEDDMKMKRMIFRTSKGRAIPTFFDLTIENRTLKTKTEKKIFTIFYQGGSENVLQRKLLSVCDLFGASRFTIPKREDIPNEINALQKEICDKKDFLKSAETTIRDFIKDKIGSEGVPAKYEMYRLFFFEQKLIFTNLNKCKLRGNFIDGEVWIPQEKFQEVQNQLLKITESDNSKLTAILTDFDAETDKAQPPTYFKLNDFTAPFQMIVSEYGVPRYREINPGLFTIITFPFMFGVMFGDIGHGFLLSLLGGFLVFKYDDIVRQYPNMKQMMKVRYLFLFLGLFAFYNGWMYDDFLSLPLGIFGTCYKDSVNPEGKKVGERKPGCVYPFGIDPKWYVASNELSFLNSLKMKTSVIIGIIQMIFGILLKGMNTIYFGNIIDFIFEFIPQIIFMCLLFGYLVIMIFIKWGTDWSADPSKAPSLISQLLMVFLNVGSVGPEGNKTPLYNKDNYEFQENLQFYLLIISVICVPIMWLPKPFIETFKKSKQPPEEGKHEEGFTDFFVHQTIETIEFVLGTVSHTASYLRLWALSLAHAQLAKVFFEITLLGSIQNGSVIGMIVGFFILAHITLGVLMGMDLMECFLHTLRLHWVEFQNKFYKADGYAFTPYSFKYINDSFL